MAANCKNACAQLCFDKMAARQMDAAARLADLDNCGYNPQSSQNWPWGKGAARGLVTEDWSELNGLAEIERKEGLRRIEGPDSELYGPDVAAYRAISLSHGNAPDSETGKALRATIALLAAVGLPGGLTSSIFIVGGKQGDDNEDASHYNGGFSIACPGHRFNGHQGTLAATAAWALGYAPSFKWKLSEDLSNNFWSLHLLEVNFGAPFGSPTPESAWGLLPGDREAFRAVIEQDSITGLDRVLEALAGWRGSRGR